jgi:hypothetical protein
VPNSSDFYSLEKQKPIFVYKNCVFLHSSTFNPPKDFTLLNEEEPIKGKTE